MGICACDCEHEVEKEENKMAFSEPKSKILEEKDFKGLPDIKGHKKAISNEIALENETIEEEKEKENKVDKLSANYLKIKRIGKSGYAKILLVKNLLIEKYYVMKIIKRGTDKIKENEILNEINIIRYLDHPNIVKVIDVLISPNNYFIVTEYCPEGDLYEEIIKRGEPLKEAECAFIIQQILVTMKYFHKIKIIHRDIKPENIMISKREDDGRLQIKIVDFGSATIYSGQEESEMIGSKDFIAPEVFNKKYDKRCDIWSLGVTMYFLLTGCLPFEPKKEDSEICEIAQTGKYDKKSYQYKRLSKNAKDLIGKFLSVDPEKRITVKDALEHEWFKTSEFEEINKGNKIDPNLVNQLISNISNYKKDNKLKCAVLAYLIHNNTNLESCVQAGKLFKDIDSNHDGKIEFEELKLGLEKFWEIPKEEVETKTKEIFDNLDNGSKNFIAYEEFIRAAVDPKIFLYKNYLKFVFNYFDRDQSGDISFDEIQDRVIRNSDEDGKVIENELKNILAQNKIDENEPITFKLFSDLMFNILKN